MKMLNKKASKGLFITLILSQFLVACSGGSVSGYGGAAPGNGSGTGTSLVPTATPFGTTYKSLQSVTLTANKAGATFYYTTDGTPPTTSSTLYTGPINISATTTTLKAIAKGADGVLSAVITEVYTIDTTAPTISASHANGSYAAAQYVTLSSGEPTTTIYYTTGGSSPTTSSKIYTNPIVTGFNNPSFTLKFFGQDVAGNSSGVTTRTYSTGTTITDLAVVDTAGSAQTNVPITFGQVFAVGEVASGTSVAGTLSSTGNPIPLQVNVKATHGDGSVRHAIISAVLPNLGSNQTETISFTNAAMLGTTPIAPAVPANLANIDVTVGGILYRADAATLLAGAYTQWLSGPIVNEWIVSGPLRKVSDNAAHPHLEARFAIRSFAGSSKTKVDVTVENNKTFTAGAQNFTYNASIYVGDSLVDTITSLEHFHHARWHKSFWWGTAPQVHLKHNIDYLIATKAVPNYDRSVVPSPAAITNMVTNIVGKTGPMKAGLALAYMPNTGGRTDIGPLPGWYALYLLSMDKSAKDVMMATADGSGSWPIHYRDETSTGTTTDATNTYGLPVRVDKAGNDAVLNAPYINISTHGNLASDGPLPVPRCVSNSCATSLTPDASHQPSLVYLPYVVTGDYFYLEELHFWAAWNPLGTAPIYREYAKGLVKWDQLRAQAWDLRTLGQTAYITPDTHTLKQYFTTLLNNNITDYHNFYVVGNPNQLGIIQYVTLDTAKGTSTGFAPWQDDFFTWSIANLVDLGFTNANQLLAWKSKFPVGRMTDSVYCWTLAVPYIMEVRPTSSSPFYSSIGDTYNAIWGGIVGVDGTTVLTKACGSQAHASWLTANLGVGTFVKGEMQGYSYSTTGFPSNMQIGVAAAAASGIANSKTAWIKFMSRSVKPDYTTDPQFAVVPRN